MTQTEQIEIPLSKKKILWIIFGAIAFVVLGALFLITPSKFISPVVRSTTTIFIVGLASVLFFGLCAIVAFRKLFDNKIGFTINREGIIDNSSGVSAGVVLWSDIKGIEIFSVAGQKFLLFIVANPQDYIDRVTNPLKRKAMEMNYKTYGSPISISASALQMNFDGLHNLLIEKMKEYKQ